MTDRCRHCVTRGLMCYGCRDNPERWNNPKLFEKGEQAADGLVAGHTGRVQTSVMEKYRERKARER